MTTAPAVDEREHIEVLRSAVSAVMADKGSSARCYSYDDVPGSSQDSDGNTIKGKLPNIFAIVSVERTLVLPRRLCGRAGRSGWRASFRTLGRTVAESQWALLCVIEAVEEKRFVIDDFLTGPLTSEPGDAPRWDEKRYVGTTFYTYEI